MNLQSRTESRSGLVAELAEEFLDRYRNGERPSLKEYSDRYPQYAEEIREVFPALAMLEHIAVAETPAVQTPAAMAVKPRPMAIKQLGDFRVLREIGHGGMGVVYEAEQVSLGRHVALKLLPPQLLRDPKQRRRFEREARAAARLHHANIVSVFGVGEQEGTPYYAMQFIAGHGLDQVLDQLRRLRAGGPARELAEDLDLSAETSGAGAGTAMEVARSLWTAGVPVQVSETEAGSTPAPASAAAPPPDSGTAPPGLPPADLWANAPLAHGSSTASLLGASSGTSPAGGSSRHSTYWQGIARIGVQVAAALAYAHSQGVLHRDIKPSNLLLDAHGSVWITDFGLAKLDDQQNLTATGDILGTLRYMPPEAFESRHDARGDVYSLGITLYEMLAFRPAFDETDRARLIRMVTADVPQRLRKLNTEVPRDLETVIHKAIDRDPDHRYQTATELADDLRLFVEDRPVRARPASDTEKFLRWCRRNPIPTGLMVALVLVFWAGFGLVAWNWRVAVAERKAKEDQTQKAFIATADAKAAEKKSREVAEQADRSLYFSLIDRARLERESGDVAESEAILDRCDPARRGWEWRFLKGLNHSELFNLRGHRDGSPVNAVAYSPDGRWIATADGGDLFFENPGQVAVPGTVVLWDATTGQAVATLHEHTHAVSDVAFSRDGRILASNSFDGTIVIHEVPTGRLVQTVTVRKPIPAGDGPGKHERPRILALTPDGKTLATVADDRALTVWDVATSRVLTSFPARDGSYSEAVFSPDGRRLAALAGESLVNRARTIRIWDLATGAELQALASSVGLVSLAIGPDSRTIAGGSEQGFISLWDTASGTLHRVLSGHQGLVTAVAFSADGQFLASCGNDRTARLWDLPSGRMTRVIRGHTHPVDALAFSPDGNQLITGSQDSSARVWDLTIDRQTGAAEWGMIGETEAIAYARGGGEFVSLHRNGNIEWHRSGSLTSSGWRDLGPALSSGVRVQASAFSADGRVLILVTPPLNEPVCLGADEGRPPIRLKGHTLEVSSTALSADGARAATAARTPGDNPDLRCEVIVWETGTARSLLRKDIAGEITYRVAVDPAGERIAVSYGTLPGNIKEKETKAATTVEILEVNSGRVLLRSAIAGDHCFALAFSPDGRRLAAAGRNRLVRIWDVASGQTVAESRQGPVGGEDVAFSPDGLRLAIAAHQQVKLMDAETAAEVLSLRGRPQLSHTNIGFNPRVCFSPDGRSLLAVCDDGMDCLAEWSVPPEETAAREVFRRQLLGSSIARHLWLAWVYRGDVARRDAVLLHLDQAARMGLEDDFQHRFSAELYATIGEWKRVEDRLDGAVAVADGDDGAVIQAGLLCAKYGRLQHARALLERLRSVPESLLSWTDDTQELFALLGASGIHLALCEALWARYGGSTNPDDLHRLALASVLFPDTLRDPTALVRLTRSVLEQSPASQFPDRAAEAPLMLGAAHVRADETSKAEPFLREAIAKAPGPMRKAYAETWMALCLWKQGHRKDARTWFDQADRFVRAHVPRGRPELDHFRPELPESQYWWHSLLVVWRETQGLLLDESFPADPFAHRVGQGQ